MWILKWIEYNNKNSKSPIMYVYLISNAVKNHVKTILTNYLYTNYRSYVSIK